MGIGELYATACAVVWSLALVLFRKCGKGATPLSFNLFKNSVALLAFLLTLGVLGISLRPNVPALTWAIMLGSGAVGLGLADTLFLSCMDDLGAGRSALLECWYLPFVLVGDWLWLKSKIHPLILLGVLLVFAGTMLVVGGADESDEELPQRQRWKAAGKGILATLLMAISVVVAKPHLELTSPWWSTTVRLIGGELLLLVHASWALSRGDRSILAVFRPSPWWRISIPASLIGTYLAMILWITGLKYLSATTSSVLSRMSAFYTLILARIFLGEALTGRRLAAIILGFAGAVLCVYATRL